MFQGALAVKFGWICSRGYGVRGFKLRQSGSPKFSSPPSGETATDPKNVRGTTTCSRSSIITPSLVRLGFYPPRWRPKTLSYFCLSVSHAVERHGLCARFRHEGVRLQKRFWIAEGLLLCIRVQFSQIPAKRRHHKMPKSKKRQNVGGGGYFSPPEGHRINGSRRNLAHKRVLWVC